MKFYQLLGVMGGESAVLESSLIKPEWDRYYEWYLNLKELVNTRDRAKLYAVMPNDLVREVLAGSTQKLFLHEGWLRSYQFSDEDIEMSVLAAFDKFGGDALDDAFEKGSSKVC